jgi:hypothetical protein
MTRSAVTGRRGMIDKVFSIVLTIIIVLLLSIFLYTSVFTGYTSEQTVARQQYERDYGDLMMHSFLISHENESGLTYEALLARSLKELDTTVTVEGKRVNVTQRYAETFDELMGEDNYYFEVRPVVKGAVVTYILDGSETMQEKRERINQDIPGLMQRLKALLGPDAYIAFHLYILDGPDGVPHCSEFAPQPGMDCTDLAGDQFYQELMLKGFSPPYPAPYRSYTEWMYSTHQATAGEMSTSDWASATAYASYRYKESDESLVSNKHIIVVVADELTATSKADTCFALEGLENLAFCEICNATCPVDRAYRVINQTKAVLERNQDLFIGFTAFDCDYAYKPSMTTIGLTEYTCQYIDRPDACTNVDDDAGMHPPANAIWCEQQSCGGCAKPSPAPAWDGKYCFHRNCDGNITTHLQELADVTNGQVAPLNDLDLLTDVVFDYFQNSLNSFNFTVGIKNETLERYVVEQPLTLATGDRLTLSFWVYEKDYK